MNSDIDCQYIQKVVPKGGKILFISDRYNKELICKAHDLLEPSVIDVVSFLPADFKVECPQVIHGTKLPKSKRYDFCCVDISSVLSTTRMPIILKLLKEDGFILLSNVTENFNIELDSKKWIAKIYGKYQLPFKSLAILEDRSYMMRKSNERRNRR